MCGAQPPTIIILIFLVNTSVFVWSPPVSGLSAPSLVSLRSPGVLKVMAILNKIGVNRQGFSLLLCSRLYATFARPKFEYGLAISRLTATDLKSIENLQDRCLRLLVGGHRTSCAYHSILSACSFTS
ncbi:hypothetical protein G6F45_013795 [Rhizopus arrhizus]|nr:hypothetical protein G6F45_013795 [Rhizopus arrhizus]